MTPRIRAGIGSKPSISPEVRFRRFPPGSSPAEIRPGRPISGPEALLRSTIRTCTIALSAHAAAARDSLNSLKGLRERPARDRPCTTCAGSTPAMAVLSAGYLKAVWPGFLGAFLRSGRRRGPGKAFTNVRDFQGPRGRPDFQHTHQRFGQTAFRYPVVAIKPRGTLIILVLVFVETWCRTHLKLAP